MPADETIFHYNGITLTNVVTREFHQELVYDASGTDVVYHKFTISVLGILHPGFMEPYPGTIVDSIGLRQAFENVRNALSEPRGVFDYSIGGQTILSAMPGTPSHLGDSDVANGPKPIDVRVTQLAGARLMRVEVKIEVCKVQCGEFSNTRGVLSNRWSSIDDYDQDFYCTRTISGRLQVAIASLEPHSMRSLVVPPLQPGFKRQSMIFNVDNSGLVMDYTIIDRQVAFAAPGGATDWRGRHTVSSPDGLATYGEVEVELVGPPTASKTALLMTCAQIIESKLTLKLLGKDQFVTVSAAIVDHLHENRIGMNVRVMYTSPQTTVFNIGNNAAKMGKPTEIEEYNRFRSPVPAVTGEASPIGLFVAYWQSPCNDQHAIFKTEATVPEELPEESVVTEPIVSQSELPEYTPPYSSSHIEAAYTEYEIVGEYDHDPLRIALPIAGGSEQDPDVFVVQLARPNGGITRRRIKINAERIGKPPELPSLGNYEEGGGTAVLLRVKIMPFAPRLTPDGGNFIHRIEAEYEFALTKALPRIPSIRAGSRAYDLTNADDNVIPDQIFIPGIL